MLDLQLCWKKDVYGFSRHSFYSNLGKGCVRCIEVCKIYSIIGKRSCMLYRGMLDVQ